MSTVSLSLSQVNHLITITVAGLSVIVLFGMLKVLSAVADLTAATVRLAAEVCRSTLRTVFALAIVGALGISLAAHVMS